MIENFPYKIAVADESNRLTVRQKPNMIVSFFAIGLFATLLSGWGLICWGGLIRKNSSTSTIVAFFLVLGYLVVLVTPSFYAAIVSCCSRVFEVSISEQGCMFRQIPFLRLHLKFHQVESIQLMVTRCGNKGWLCLKRNGKRALVVIAEGGHLSEPYITEEVLSTLGKRLSDAIKSAYDQEIVRRAPTFRFSWW